MSEEYREESRLTPQEVMGIKIDYSKAIMAWGSG